MVPYGLANTTAVTKTDTLLGPPIPQRKALHWWWREFHHRKLRKQVRRRLALLRRPRWRASFRVRLRCTTICMLVFRSTTLIQQQQFAVKFEQLCWFRPTFRRTINDILRNDYTNSFNTVMRHSLFKVVIWDWDRGKSSDYLFAESGRKTREVRSRIWSGQIRSFPTISQTSLLWSTFFIIGISARWQGSWLLCLEFYSLYFWASFLHVLLLGCSSRPMVSHLLRT